MKSIAKCLLSRNISTLLLTCLISMFSVDAFSQETALFQGGAPEGFPSEVNLSQSQSASQSRRPIIPMAAGEEASQLMSAGGSWWDSGSGPGQLTQQYYVFYSDILSGSSSGYMTFINYNWQGSFNGWNDTLVYLLIVNSSGAIVDHANVTSFPTGGVSVPYGTYPASYDVAFAFIVNRAPTLNIYNGPSFSYVSATVQQNQ